MKSMMLLASVVLASCTQRQSELSRLKEVQLEVVDYSFRNRMTVPSALSDIPALSTNKWAMENVELAFTGRMTSASFNPSTQILLRVKSRGPGKPEIVAFADGHMELMVQGANHGHEGTSDPGRATE